MDNVKEIELERELSPGGAIYQVVDEGNGNFLLGLGLWDRANIKHTKKTKDETKGQVVRVTENDEIIARSPPLENIIYQLEPVDEERIFVGCRSGRLLYLNRNDLSVREEIDFDSTGLYFWLREGNTIIATMRTGGILFYDLETSKAEIVEVVDPKIRMWAIAKDNHRIVAGSYKSDLVLIEGKKVVKRKKVLEGGSVWTIDKFQDHFLVGTAKGNLIAYDKNLENPEVVYRVHRNAISATALPNDSQIILGDLKGDLHIWGRDSSVVHYEHSIEEKVKNTIWWITLTPDNLMRTAYANGQMRTFRLK